MNVLNDIILFVCFNQLKSRRTYGKLSYMVMRQVAIKADIFLAAFLVLIICACADDPDALKDVGTDRLYPPSHLMGNYILVNSSKDDVPIPENSIFMITEDDYIRATNGNIVFSLKDEIEKGKFKLLKQLCSPAVWILYFPDEEMKFELEADGMTITDIYKDNEIKDSYERVNIN